jgi:alpha-ribazole phosphatase
VDLILIRHPAVDVPAGYCYGSSDVPLAAAPETAAEALRARLAALGAAAPDVLESSPLARCGSVAAAIARSRAEYPAVREDARLAELDFGAWELRAWHEIERAQIDAWAADFRHARPHGGESVAQFEARVRGWLEDLPVMAVPRQTRWVVTHAGVMRALAALTLALPLEQCMRWPLDYAGIVWLRRELSAGSWQLVRWNT